MGKTIIAVALLALIGAPAALAQSGTNTESGKAAKSSRQINSAPVGHRQPRAGDIPSEQSGNPLRVDPAEAALDRKIKSICRGC